MAIRFAPVFEVNIEHEYFDGDESPFRVQPNRECRGLLRNLGLLFRETDSGFAVLHGGIDRTAEEGLEAGAPRIEMLRPLDSGVVFQFELQPLDPTFLNVTELPFERSFYVFDNRGGRLVGETALLTHAAETDVATQEDGLELRRESFSRTYDTDGVLFERSLLDAHGEPFPDGTVSYHSEHDSSREDSPRRRLVVSADLGGPGRYGLRVQPDPTTPDDSASSATETFYAGDEFARRRSFGVIEIEVSDRIEPSFRIVDLEGLARVDADGMPAPARFRLAFASRRTTWRYHVSKRRSEVSLNGVTIKNDDPAFDRVLEGDSLVFTSTEPIALTRSPRLGIELAVGESDSDSSDLKPTPIENLPNPRTDSFVKDDEKLVSEMFVYV